MADRAFLHDGKDYIDLGVLPGANFSIAEAITDDGTVYGYSHHNVTGAVFSLFRWREGVMEALPKPPGSSSVLMARGNTHGECVGRYSIGSPATIRPFVLLNDLTTIDLALPLGATDGQADAINDHHVIAGTVWGFPNDPPGRQAVVWRNGVPSILTPLPGDDRARARDISNTGIVIGTSEAQFGGTQGCIWYHGQPHRPMDLINPDLQLFAFTLNAISNDGVITGSVSGDGPEAVRLIPVRRTTGDTNCDKLVGIRDLLNVIGDWSAPGGPSDVNFDRMVNLPDLIEVITRWGAVPH